MKTQQEIEKDYRAARGQLRLLRGSIDVWLSEGHPQEVEGFVPPTVKTMRQMRSMVNRVIGIMDCYEDAKAYNDEMGALQARMAELSGGFWKYEEKGGCDVVR